MKYHVGTSGWSYNHWRNIFYPPKLAAGKWLNFYAQNFGTVEVNMTFYRTPTGSTLARWYDITPDDFTFTLKAPRTITHVKRLHDTSRSLREFYTLLEGLGEKARCLLFQLPPSFQLTRENTERIASLTELVDKRYDHVIEFRHSSWWCDASRDILGDTWTFCSVDGLEMPGGIVITGDVIYLRFHGERYSGLYGDDTLRDYADRLYTLAGKNGISRVYVYFNNDIGGYALTNALRMRELLDERFPG